MRKAIPAATTAEAMRKRRRFLRNLAADAVHRPVVKVKNVGKTCCVPHYRGTFNDGTSLILPTTAANRSSSSAVGQMIRGFDAAVAEMEVGEKVNIHLMPERLR